MTYTYSRNTATMNPDNTSPVSKISSTSSALDRNVTVDDTSSPALDKHLKIVIVHPHCNRPDRTIGMVNSSTALYYPIVDKELQEMNITNDILDTVTNHVKSTYGRSAATLFTSISLDPTASSLEVFDPVHDMHVSVRQLSTSNQRAFVPIILSTLPHYHLDSINAPKHYLFRLTLPNELFTLSGDGIDRGSSQGSVSDSINYSPDSIDDDDDDLTEVNNVIDQVLNNTTHTSTKIPHKTSRFATVDPSSIPPASSSSGIPAKYTAPSAPAPSPAPAPAAAPAHPRSTLFPGAIHPPPVATNARPPQIPPAPNALGSTPPLTPDRIRILTNLDRTPIVPIKDIHKLVKNQNISCTSYSTFSDFYTGLLAPFLESNGIYAPPISNLSPHSFLGTEWTHPQFPINITYRELHMARSLRSILQQGSVVPPDKKSAITSARDMSGYRLLRNLLLQDQSIASTQHFRHVVQPAPYQKGEDLHLYVNKWTTYYNAMKSNGNTITLHQQYQSVAQSLPSALDKVKCAMEDYFTSTPNCDRQNRIPMPLTMEDLATTITRLANHNNVQSWIAPADPSTPINMFDSNTVVQKIHSSPVGTFSAPDTPSTVSTPFSESLNDPPISVDQIEDTIKAIRTRTRRPIVCFICKGPHTFQQCPKFKPVQDAMSSDPKAHRIITKFLNQQGGSAESVKKILSIVNKLQVHDDPDPTADTIKALSIPEAPLPPTFAPAPRIPPSDDPLIKSLSYIDITAPPSGYNINSLTSHSPAQDTTSSTD